MSYTHLTQAERYQIYVLKKAGHRLVEIGLLLNRAVSTISRELKRNTGLRGYRPRQAQHMSESRRAINGRVIDEATWKYVASKLLEDWSPEQISAHACVSTETIYQHIYADKRSGGSLYRHLRCQKQRRKRYGKIDRRGIIAHRQSIDLRPAVVEERCRIGDWEADTLIGRNHKQAIVSLVERKSGFTLIRKVERKTAKEVSQAMIGLLKPFRLKVLTITSDNGREFAHHETIAKQLRTDFYFAHPYASYERGTNENTNGLIRQYFPKQMKFEDISNKDIQLVMQRLNHRPRKRLGFLTPHQVFYNLRVALQI